MEDSKYIEYDLEIFDIVLKQKVGFIKFTEASRLSKTELYYIVLTRITAYLKTRKIEGLDVSEMLPYVYLNIYANGAAIKINEPVSMDLKWGEAEENN